MLLEIALFFTIGTALGVLAGLVPGLHPNTLLVVLVSLFWLVEGQAAHPILALVVSMSVSNTIANFIPSIFLGAPDPDNCLSVLPGHRFLLQGKGYEALFLTVVGGVSVMLLTVLALPFILWFIPFLYVNIHTYMHWLLLAVLAMLIYHEKGVKKAYSLLVFIIAGAAGFMLLSVLPAEQVLFPALSGLFGLSIIITSITQTTSLPPQKMTRRPRFESVKGSLAGWLAGMFVGILPGIGAAQAGVLASRALGGKERDFLVALGGINTANIIFTFIALYTVQKTRSGAAWAVSEIFGGITLNDVYFILLIALLSCFISSLVTLKLGRSCIALLERANYRKLNISVLIILSSLVFAFSGVFGMVIAALCASLGLACTRMGVKRMYLMGFLMLPTILYYSGVSLGFMRIIGI
jgi:putative membrane protein